MDDSNRPLRLVPSASRGFRCERYDWPACHKLKDESQCGRIERSLGFAQG